MSDADSSAYGDLPGGACSGSGEVSFETVQGVGSMASLDRKRVEEYIVERAEAGDVAVIHSMIGAAYSKYIARIGKLPAPMTADFGKLVETGNVYVLRVGGSVVGSVLLLKDGDSIKVNDLVVDPSAQGRGYGSVLMKYAEQMARAQGLPAVTLFTNEKMHENIAIYTKIGFTETGRKMEDGFNRVYFRKDLA